MSRNRLRAGTILITGISASGKSSMGKLLRERLIAAGITDVKLIDGEEVRDLMMRLGKNYGYSAEERNELAIKIAEMACEHNDNGTICIVCAICHAASVREEIRRIVKNVMEVYLDCPVSICASRDKKGHYEKAFKGLYDSFIGVTEPYQRSDGVELVLNTGRDTIEECASKLLTKAKDFILSKCDEERDEGAKER